MTLILLKAKEANIYSVYIYICSIVISSAGEKEVIKEIDGQVWGFG